MKKIFLIFFLLITGSFFVQIFMATPCASQIAPPPPMSDPTPDWNHLIRGWDYAPNQIILALKNGLLSYEEDRVMRKLSFIGQLSAPRYSAFGFTMYSLKITNRMTERQVIENLRKDPALEYVELDTVTHNAIMELNYKGPTPAPTPVPYGFDLKQTVPIPEMIMTPSNSEPDWDHLIRGWDYEPNIILVMLKNNISPAEETRVKSNMASMGVVTAQYFGNLQGNLYKIKIVTGMSERQAVDIMGTDPAVKYARLVVITHNENDFIAHKELTPIQVPSPAPLPSPDNK